MFKQNMTLKRGGPLSIYSHIKIDGVLSLSLCMSTEKNLLSVWDQEKPPKYTLGTIHTIG